MKKQTLKDRIKKEAPDFSALFDMCQEFNVSPILISRIIRGLKTIPTTYGGSGFGEVTVEIARDSAIFVKTIDSDRVDEPLTVEQPKYD